MTDEPPGGAAWIGMVLLTLSAAMAGTLELMFLTQFYAGSVIVPVTILGAIGGNVLLPRWGSALIGGMRGAVIPFAAWLIVTLVPTLYMRPEGDQLVLGAFGQNYAYYGLLLGGAIAGFSTIVLSTEQQRR